MHGGNAGDPAAAAQRGLASSSWSMWVAAHAKPQSWSALRATAARQTPPMKSRPPSTNTPCAPPCIRARFGGRAVDAKLRAHVVKEIKRRQRVDLADNARAMGRLLGACESAKISLTGAAQAQINVEADGMDFSANVSRAALEAYSRCRHARSRDGGQGSR